MLTNKQLFNLLLKTREKLDKIHSQLSMRDATKITNEERMALHITKQLLLDLAQRLIHPDKPSASPPQTAHSDLDH